MMMEIGLVLLHVTMSSVNTTMVIASMTIVHMAVTLTE